MHIMLVSACQKRALKKTRAILDSYAPRIGERTWAAPMTQEGLDELYRAMRKVATRQTAVACYLNHGRRSMKLIWTVGAKHRFDEQGRYPVGSTRANKLRPEVPQWLRAAGLLAGAAGDMHDIGKASKRFQTKLDPNHQGSSADQVRHEWLSVKLLQRLRHNGWDWRAAWQDLNTHLNTLKLGERVLGNNADGLSDGNEAVDFMIVTHHGLLASGSPSQQQTNQFQKHFALPTHHAHVREHIPHDDSQFQCAGDLPVDLFKDYQHKMQRLQRQSIEHLRDVHQAMDYWSALAMHSRAALIFADHTVSAIQRAPSEDQAELFANTTIDDGKRRHNQKLKWHLDQVGQRAARVAVQMITDLNLGGLSEPSVERILAKSSGRFVWQNKAAQALQKIQRQDPDRPALVLNIAGTGSGKTRMNLRAMCCLCPENPRVAIALNLRSLTLQTGSALKKSIGLNQDELAVVIGDKTVVQLYEAQQQQQYADDDENPIEPEIQAWGTADLLPEWLNPLFEQRGKGVNHSARAILTSPILVSTIDYLIAAGEPNQQGHHVKALLRLMSSDLILDEIDSYDPPALVAVLRLIQTAACYGRRVVCSSATLSRSIAERIEQAFDAGLRLRQALYGRPQSAIYAILDDQVTPKVWMHQQGDSVQFQQYYQQHLQQLSTQLADKPIYRLAQIQPVSATATIEDWQHGVLKACQQLHHDHAWLHQSSKKRLSIGLVRVAHVKTAIQLARFLAQQYPEARVACYHANDWLMSRHYKEMMLDELLSRQLGSAHLQQHTLIKTMVSETESNDLPLIVVATPVEEVGRDHCFDWGVIDVSSCQSLVQTAGRVNRHRLVEVVKPNLRIMQFNAQYCKNINKSKKIKVFCYPGYEPYSPQQGKGRPSVGYPSQDVQKLLPWSAEGQLQVDARLRFAIDTCRLAEYDDAGIAHFIQSFYQSSQDRQGLFSHVFATALGLAPYQATRLRDPSYKQMFFFRMDDQNLQFFAKELTKSSYGKAVPIDTKVDHHFQQDDRYTEHAWLNIHPTKMIKLCDEFNISHRDGCRVELTQYKDQIDQVEYGEWVYDLAFGLVRDV